MTHIKHILILLAAVLAFTSTNPALSIAKAPTAAAVDKPVREQCAALTKKGTRCKHKAAEGSKYCKMHANYDPSAAPTPKAKRVKKVKAAETGDSSTEKPSTDDGSTD